MQPFTIKTNNYIIKTLETVDLESMYELRSNEIIAGMEDRNIDKNKDETFNFINKIIKGINENKWYYFVILKENIFVGSICIWNFYKNTAELGYSILPNYQRLGIMSEVLKHIELFCFDTLDLDVLYAYTNENNLNSIDFLMKNNYSIFNYINELNLKKEKVTMMQFQKLNKKHVSMF